MWKYPAARTIIGISLGAVIGALCRYYCDIWITQFLGTTFPYSTMVINLTGCFVMGFFATFSLIPVITIHPDLRLMVTTGFLGSYTTFSSYELDTAKLITRSLENDLVYWGGTALLGLMSLQLGIAFAEKFYSPKK
uniref:Fluoride-specific ion channel FluC n=1 Tax=Oscillatoriales cyanobacterium SpSt-402 TaxID=2282168 RepID=A0A832H5H3_9CYAN